MWDGQRPCNGVGVTQTSDLAAALQACSISPWCRYVQQEQENVYALRSGADFQDGSANIDFAKILNPDPADPKKVL